MTNLSRRGVAGTAGRTDTTLPADYTNSDYITNLRTAVRTPGLRSLEMNSLHEALARERMRELQQDAQRSRVARELAAAGRWRRRELRARAAHRRHAQRAEQAASASAAAVAH